MIHLYQTKCSFCETEEEFISTSDEATCGKCGKKTEVLKDKDLGPEDEDEEEEIEEEVADKL